MKPKSAIIGLCGASGSGKTLTCQKIVKVLRSKGVACCGFISPAVFEQSQKTAIKVQWLQSDKERILMATATETSQKTFGRWQIHPDAFEWIDQNLQSSLDCQVFICDEIGPLEVLEGKGWVKALEILDGRRLGVNVITFRPSLQEYFKQRYPDMTLYDLDQKGDDDRAIRYIKKFFGID
jgi:nucleoside-triphosphatase THEP1